jgi:hypothetical protein
MQSAQSPCITSFSALKAPFDGIGISVSQRNEGLSNSTITEGCDLSYLTPYSLCPNFSGPASHTIKQIFSLWHGFLAPVFSGSQMQ